MKDVGHGPLKCGTGDFKAEGHDSVSEHTPCGSEGSLVLVLGAYSDFVVARETIH